MLHVHAQTHLLHLHVILEWQSPNLVSWQGGEGRVAQGTVATVSTPTWTPTTVHVCASGN